MCRIRNRTGQLESASVDSFSQAIASDSSRGGNFKQQKDPATVFGLTTAVELVVFCRMFGLESRQFFNT
jgi:hypothetical protein